MEQRNLFIAIILSIIVFVVWNYFFMPQPKTIPGEDQAQKEVITTTENQESTEKKIETFDTETPVIAEIPSANVKTTTIKTPLYDIEISNLGAVFKNIKLKKFKETNGENSELKTLIDSNVPMGSYGLSFKNKVVPDLDKAVFSVSNDEPEINVTEGSVSLTYSWISKSKIIIEKTFEFKADTYLINFHVTVKNASQQQINDELVVDLNSKINDKSSFAFEGPSLYLNKSHEEIKVSKIEDKNQFSGDIEWISIQDRYFLMSLIPEPKNNIDVNLGYNEDTGIIQTRLSRKTDTLVPGTQKVFDYSIYAGPKSLSILKSMGHNLDKVVDFGTFDFLAKPCLMGMDWIYKHVIKNYGVAIIILTIFFKIILWPLGNKSYKSMNDMKKLQPLVAEIREKHKNDKQKMNEEMMNLYKTYKVNPLSGCLPLLVQMPIFFAFYRMLYSAIELRHAPFMGWITDLSAPDRLFSFNFTIPYFEPPTGIPVLTLLMGASMFIQQKMSPPAGDPAQAKMMLLMPVFMTFIFMNFSSGLVLYWLVNNIISIAQQYYIMKKNA